MKDSSKVIGYAFPWSVAPGDEVQFHLSSDVLKSASARIVRIRCADADPRGPGMKLHHQPSPLDGEIQLASHPIHNGSYGDIPDTKGLTNLKDFSIGAWIWPTFLTGKDQVVFARGSSTAAGGWRLYINSDGCLAFEITDGTHTASLAADRPVVVREWLYVHASFSATEGKLTLTAESLHKDGGRAQHVDLSGSSSVQPNLAEVASLTFAAELSGKTAPHSPTRNHFNGKIDRPRLYGRALSGAEMRRIVDSVVPDLNDPHLIGAWDFSLDISTDAISDRSRNALHGTVRRMPMRAATGANWTGTRTNWTAAPEEYGAIHFHDDDVEDAGWPVTQSWKVPDGIRSGFYSLELTAEHDGVKTESHIPFFVRPPRGKTTADIVVIAPTATYLAYANNKSRIDQIHFEVMADGLIVLSPDDLYNHKHRELGSSVYDTHRDHSGVCYSSARRPILNQRPRAYTFNYVNDTHLLDWLEEEGFAYDVITDEDLDREGVKILKPYRVAVTMTHPEYTSKNMLDALQEYQDDGGRHMYLGGNGFYWRIAFHPTKSGLIELRRGVTGLRSWEAEAGEDCLSFTGEPSGLWRSSGRAPQRLTGVGFSAQVFDRGASYRRLPDSHLPRAAFVMEGLADDEVIGNFGLRAGGAASLEIDRADRDLGTAPEAMILATADNTGAGGIPAPEELPVLYRGFTGEESTIARADIVLTPTAEGGAVFSVGSIGWCCALSHNGYRNNVARITKNVLSRFLDPAPI
jgi:hypothetical protein